MGSQINGVQKAIGMKKKVGISRPIYLHGEMLIHSQNKEDATELLAQKAELETKKKELEEAAVAKEVQRDRKIRTIGNYVHESVPVSNDEVWVF
jgi:seryl-tRNA synthetase